MSFTVNRREFIAGSAAGLAALSMRLDEAQAAGGAALASPLETRDYERLITEALSRGAQFAEVFYERYAMTKIVLDEQRIRSATYSISQGVGVRVIVDGRVGYAHSDDLSPERLLETARTAGFIASGSARTAAKLTRVAPPSIIRVSLLPGDVAVADKAALLIAGDEAARGLDKRVIQVQGSFLDGAKSFTVANSDGRLVSDELVMNRLSLYAVAEQDGERHSGFYGGGGRVGFDCYATFTPQAAGREASRVAIAQLGAREAPMGEQTVVLSNGWSGVLLHEAVGHGLEADFNRKGTSLYTGKVGQQVASELVTVIDDATLPGRRGSYNVDDEGEPGQRKVLIDKGVLTGYMSDRLNADLMGIPRTGNGRRESFRHIPLPRMSNTFMSAGTDAPEDVIRSVSKGFYARTFGGGQVDITNGNFVFEVREGYLIEDGKITAPVKGATLIGVGPEVLGRVSMVGSDAELDPGIGTCGKDGQGVPVGVGLATLKIDGMTVGGTGR
ncbi:MAG: metallopeptidase TldD-related protein [Candidatus Alcyoniella australis]|nr:metallopeptidase TldD-related protein [Candidatus Alcyoniella australis]